MAGYVCAVAGGKGGVGRTTTVLNLGTALASTGHSVVVVDADLSMSNVVGILGVDPTDTLHDILAGDASVDDALIDVDGLGVIPGDRQLEAYAAADPANIGSVIDTLRERYEIVLVDTSAGISHETAVPLGVADGVLFVTTGTDVSLYDTIKTAQLTERVDGTPVGTLITHATSDTEMTVEHETLDVPMLGVIPEDERLGLDTPLPGADGSSPGGKAYQMLADELSKVFFDGKDPAGLNAVYEESWFEHDQSTPEDTDQSTPEDEQTDTQTEQADDDDDDDDVLGLFN